jgi:hypothetical protein
MWIKTQKRKIISVNILETFEILEKTDGTFDIVATSKSNIFVLGNYEEDEANNQLKKLEEFLAGHIWDTSSFAPAFTQTLQLFEMK